MEIPDRAGVMILGSCNLFPGALLPLFIFEPRYRTMLADSLAGNRLFCIAMQQPSSERESPCRIAGLGLVRASVQNENGTSHLVLLGLTRVRLGKLIQSKPYRQHHIEAISNPEPDSLTAEALAERTLDLVEQRLRMVDRLPAALLQPLVPSAPPDGTVEVGECLRALRSIECLGARADLIASILIGDPEPRQVLLETLDVEDRLRMLNRFLSAAIVRARKDPTP